MACRNTPVVIATTTTPFDMVVINNADRFQLALDVIKRVPRLQHLVEAETARYYSTMQKHKSYISEHGQDLPEISNWAWQAPNNQVPNKQTPKNH